MKCKNKNNNIQSKKMKTRQPLNASHCATQDKNEERKHNEDRKKPDNPRAKPRKKQHDV